MKLLEQILDTNEKYSHSTGLLNLKYIVLVPEPMFLAVLSAVKHEADIMSMFKLPPTSEEVARFQAEHTHTGRIFTITYKGISIQIISARVPDMSIVPTLELAKDTPPNQ